MVRKFNIDKNFAPCTINDGDELYPNGIFEFNSTIPRPSGRGFPPEGRARETMGFSNSGFHIDTPPFKAGRFIEIMDEFEGGRFLVR